MNEIKIENLWRWFIANEQQIIDAMLNESGSENIIENIDNLILDFGMFSWEIGQGKVKPWFFTISPNGDRERFKISQEIIDYAPNLDNWEFNYCKPAIDWDRTFFIYDSNMDEHHIDASNWEYVALQDEYGRIELILEAANISHLDRDTTTTAAELFLTNEIGEESRIQKILSVDIVGQLESQYNSRKTGIQVLKKYLDEL